MTTGYVPIVIYAIVAHGRELRLTQQTAGNGAEHETHGDTCNSLYPAGTQNSPHVSYSFSQFELFERLPSPRREDMLRITCWVSCVNTTSNIERAFANVCDIQSCVNLHSFIFV